MQPTKSKTRFNNSCTPCGSRIRTSSSTAVEKHQAGPRLLSVLLIVLLTGSGLLLRANAQQGGPTIETLKLDPTKYLGQWEGWGSSLAWWARAIGGTANADYYADLIYTRKTTDSYPGLGLNIVRYNVGGGGIDQSKENKGLKLQWQMDIHGYWTDPSNGDPPNWNWSADQ